MQLIAEGSNKLASVPSGGGAASSGGSAPAAGGAAAAEEKKEEKVEEKVRFTRSSFFDCERMVADCSPLIVGGVRR